MKLYLDDQWMSPYTYTVFCALREKGVSFEVEEISFKSSRSLSAEFASKSPTELIPMLSDDGFRLSESLAILEYIEEKFPDRAPLFPRDLKQRAQARMLLSWYRCGLKALRDERSTETVFYSPELRARVPLSADAAEEVSDWLKVLGELLKPGQRYLFGGTWSIADTETALMLHRLIRNGDPLDERLVAYADDIWKRPAETEFVFRNRKAYQSYYV